MAGILKVDDLRGNTSAGDITITGEGGSNTMQLQQGVAKAWTLFDQTGTTEIKDSFNISSISDTDTGEAKHTLTNNMSSGFYANPATSGEQTGGGNRSVGINGNRGQPSTSATNTYNSTLTNSKIDDDRISLCWLGDLA